MATALRNRLLARLALPWLVGLLGLAGLIAAPLAEAHASGSSALRMTVMAHDNGSNHFFFTLPTEVHAGMVEVHFVNAGSQDHMAQFFKLKAGVTESQLIKVLASFGTAKGPSAIRELLEIASGAGGAGSVQPGKTQDVIEPLTPGHYVVVCFDTTPQGVPHFLLGMHKSFFVEGEFEGAAPKSAGTIVESDHEIDVPAVIHNAGRMTLKIVVRDQTHEFGLLRVPAGTTRAQVLACIRGQTCTVKAAPIDSGGAQASAPGRTHWVELNLQPGTYAALCFVPDIRTGMPHAVMGMVTVFVVD